MVKRLDPIENDQVHLVVVECNCGYHVAWDASWLEARSDCARWPVSQLCPACGANVSYHENDDVTIQTREETRAAVDAVMERHAPPRYKTAKLVKDYKVRFSGRDLVIPAGTTVSNKTAVGFDDGYRFAGQWEGMPDDSMFLFDFTYYGINVPEWYCTRYPKNNYVAKE